MILAAGIGTRLAPLTDTTPKALVQFNGVPILENLLVKLRESGCTEVIINVHHLRNQIAEYISGWSDGAMKITLSIETELLDTGGGIKKARDLLGNEPVLFYNVDILSDLDIQKFYAAYLESGAAVPWAVKDRETTRSLLFTANKQLAGWHYPDRHLTIITRNSKGGYIEKAFSGIYIINPELFDRFPDEDVFSIMPWFIEQSKNTTICSYDHSEDLWFDLGRLQNLKSAEKMVHIQPNGQPQLK